jgi:hypothetical protein
MTKLWPAYLKSLDAVTQITVEKGRSVYTLQLVMLCMEGGVLCLLASIFIWLSTQQVRDTLVASDLSTRMHGGFSILMGTGWDDNPLHQGSRPYLPLPCLATNITRLVCLAACSLWARAMRCTASSCTFRWA